MDGPVSTPFEEIWFKRGRKKRPIYEGGVEEGGDVEQVSNFSNKSI